MTRLVYILLFLTACNEVFGLAPTTKLDARFYDAPIDGPYRCPTLGTAPAFSPYVHQLVYQDVTQYVPTRGDLAVGMCADVDYRTPVCEGPLAGPFTVSAGILPVESYVGRRDTPRPSPDGQRLLVRYLDEGTQTRSAEYYARDGSGWRRLPDLPLPAYQSTLLVSTIAMGPTGYLVIVRHDDGTLHELVDEGGTWRDLRQHPALGNSIVSLAMTMDGLRALVHGYGFTKYFDRPDLDSEFRGPLDVEGLPAVEAYMAEDCSRFYMAGLGYVFYGQQR